MTEFISSTQNAKVKFLLNLQQKSSARRENGLFVAEGLREIQHCADAGFEIDSVFCCRNISRTAELQHLLDSLGSTTRLFEVSPQVYEKIAYRDGTEGVIAEIKARSLGLDDLDLGPSPLVIVLESVEKPGNLGAVLRSADAAGADALIVCDPLTDLYNPNLIRSSVGAAFTVPTVACTSEECIEFLKSHGIKILTAQLQDSELYYNSPMTEGVAIIMGTESTGLSQLWRKAADAHIRIPMLGQIDSLNVSVSAAILLFEAVRQRNS